MEYKRAHCNPGLLVYGAHKPYATAILVWIILAIILCTIYAVFGILVVSKAVLILKQTRLKALALDRENLLKVFKKK